MVYEKEIFVGFGTACECMCHKRAGTINYCGCVLAYMQEALEDNNLDFYVGTYWSVK